jgi:hypothetical protein
MRTRIWTAAVALTALALTAPAAGAATKAGTIDFESVSAPQSPTGEGLIVDSLSSGNGISGDSFSGSVSVFGESMNPSFAGLNTAVIFDATCSVDDADGVPEDCTGGDADLFLPPLGNVLIIAENLTDNNNNDRLDSPDDADLEGQNFTFDFSGLELGTVNIASVDVADADDDETTGVIETYRNGALVTSTPIPLSGGNTVQTVAVNATDVDTLRVILAGSGAIDNIKLSVQDEEVGAQGCTPGFWKKHTNVWQGYTPDQLFNQVFGVNYQSSLTLLGALNQGGGGFAALGRHATAALLNAAHEHVDYGLTTSQVVAAVQQAFASGDPEPLKDQLDELNNAGCSVDAHGRPIA